MSDRLFNQFDNIFEECLGVFENKQRDYGPTWLLYRHSSLIDEVWRKAKRIRTLEELDDNSLIPEGREGEYIGIINYCIMLIIRLNTESGLPESDRFLCDLEMLDNIDEEIYITAYKNIVAEVRDLLRRKNNDYGNAWRSMAISSMTDQIIIRVYRIRTILKNGGVSAASEGADSQLRDIINYCVFALIKMKTE